MTVNATPAPTTAPVYICTRCPSPTVIRYEPGSDPLDPFHWVHADTGDFFADTPGSFPHIATPQTVCPYCESTEYGEIETPDGQLRWNCPDCGYAAYTAIARQEATQ